MANINDYIDWRGDVTLEESPLNEVDKMILSRFSYLPFEKIQMKEVMTIKQIMKEFKSFKLEDYNIAGDKPMVQKLKTSKRFKDLKVTDFVNEIDKKKEQQFSSITIHLPGNQMFISYRGTDSTLVGWKEDFNLSYMQHVPAQKEGKKYLEHMLDKYPKNAYVAGHSKGGNVAVYSGIYCDKKYKSRIIEIINHDGPGFDKEIVNSKEYKEILPKVHTWFPETTIIGRLLEHKEKCFYVASSEKAIMQHDIYSWQILGSKPVQVKGPDSDSNKIDNSVNELLRRTTPEERKKCIDVMYKMLSSTNAETTKEMNKNRWKNIGSFVVSYRELSPETRKLFKEVTRIMGSSMYDGAKAEDEPKIRNKIESIKKKVTRGGK